MTATINQTGYGHERLYKAKAGTLTMPDGTKVFVSFQTIVGFHRPGKQPVFTDFWSRSAATQEHIERWMREPENEGAVKTTKDQFDRAVQRFLGLSAVYLHAPVHFADKEGNYATVIHDERWS